MIRSIQRYGGYARIHSHGNLRAILDDIVDMGPDGLDPIEPPPQGDVELAYVRQKYGRHLVLFGNLEASDIENLPTAQFAEKVRRALNRRNYNHDSTRTCAGRPQFSEAGPAPQGSLGHAVYGHQLLRLPEARGRARAVTAVAARL